MYKFILYLFIVFLPFEIFAQKYLSGTISQNTVWNGDIYINGDLNVSKGVVLTIEAGSRIFFKPKTDVKKSGKDREKAELIIQGSLIARSYSNQKLITFSSESSNPQMNDWYGIIIKNPNTKSSLRYCLIEFGYKGITCYGSSPDIIDCEIQFNHHSGISCEVRSKPIVARNVIFGNGFAGINCELASMPIVSQCTISQNNFGIVVFSKSAPDIGRYPKVEGSSIGEN